MYQKQFAPPPPPVAGPGSPGSPGSRRKLTHEKPYHPFKLSGRTVSDSSMAAPTVRSDSDGSVVVVCGPSGAGKSTLIRMLLKDFPQRFTHCVSHTTRPPRLGEKPGIDYHFVGTNEFLQTRDFIEKAAIQGYMYGVSISSIEKVREAGKVCVLDIDVYGAECIKQSAIRRHAVYIFIAPPSLEVLERRLNERNESQADFEKRMENAVKEMDAQLRPNFWDYVLVNDNVHKTYDDLLDILHLTKPPLGQMAEPPQNEDTALLCRKGKVLGQHCILRGKRPSEDSMPYLRQISDQGLIFGIAHPEVQGANSATEEILRRTPFGSRENVNWIQLRQDPFVYINGRPFSVEREGKDGDPHWDRLLKIDVLDECRTYFGQILVHYEDGTHVWEPVQSIETEDEVFQKLPNSRLKRLPLNTIFTDAQVDSLRTFLRTAKTVLFSSTHGTKRVTYAMAVAALLQRSPQPPGNETSHIPAVQKLAEIVETPLNWVNDICSQVDPSGVELPPLTSDRENKHSLRPYIHLCILGAYLWNQVSAPQGKAFRMEYSDWVGRYANKLREVWDLADCC